MEVCINSKGVFVDGTEIKNVTRVDVINLNPVTDMEVVLHITANKIEVNHKNMGVKE